MFANEIFVAFVIWVNRDAGISKHCLGPGGRDSDKLSVFAFNGVLKVPKIPLHFFLLDFEIGYRRLRGDLYGELDDPAQQIPAEAYSSWKDFAILLDGGLNRDQLQQELDEAGVETRAYFDPPLHRQALYRRFYQPDREPLAATDLVSRHILCLPIHTALKDAEVRRVAEQVLRFLDSNPESASLRTPPPAAWSPLPIRARAEG